MSASRVNRLYLPAIGGSADLLQLDEPQSHRLLRVYRLQAGAEVEAFDGAGNAWRCRLQAAKKKTVTLERLEVLPSQSAPTPTVTLVLGLLKGDAQDRAIGRAVELGVGRISVVKTARSNVKLSGANRDKKLRHWRGIAAAACEQSGLNYVPEVVDIPSLDEAAAQVAAYPQRVALHPGHPNLPADLPLEHTAIFVGPEGGWADAEVQSLQALGVSFYGLGTLILRAETVPIAAISALRASWGWTTL